MVAGSRILWGGHLGSLSWDAALVVVSDIHLQSPEDMRGRLLLRLLEDIAAEPPEYLVLLGDIFDFCLGSHPFFQRKFAAIGEALSRVAAAGTKVLFIEGNHEFRMIDLPWPGVDVIENGTYTIALKSGVKVQMAHGDMIYSHRRYKAFRRLVKSSLVTGIARYLPGPWMDRLATTGSEVSRSADQYRTIQHDHILGAVDRWLENGAGDYGIFGHFHVPYAEPRRDGRLGGVYSVECWDKPNVLAFRQGAFFRLEFEGTHLGDWKPALPLIRSHLLAAASRPPQPFPSPT